jgi:hypothetical protein
MNRSLSQAGGALWIILIAVALLAALSYAVMQGGRTNTASLTTEQNRMAASEIIAYGNSVADTVQKLKLRGCGNNQLDFANTNWLLEAGSTPVHPVGHNPTAASGCGVFSGSEGKLAPNVFPDNYFIPNAAGTMKIGSSRIRRESMVGLGIADQEEILYMLPKLKKEICEAINLQLGVTTAGVAVPNWVENAGDYNGVFLASNTPYTDTNGLLANKNSFCSVMENYTFVTTLIVR